MKLIIIKNKNDYSFEKIDNFISNQSNSNFFFSINTFLFYDSLDYFQPYYILVEDNKNEIRGLLFFYVTEENGIFGIKNFFSRRCIIEGSPLITKNNNDTLELILNCLDKFLSKKVIYSEFRNFTDQKKYVDIYLKKKWIFKNHYNLILNIDDFINKKVKISSTQKNQINRSIKNGAVIKEANSIEEVTDFYKILDNLYLNVVKKPLPNLNFFLKLFNLKEFRFFLIEYQNKIIGGVLSPIHNNTIYEWYVCGLDRKYKNIYPSSLATYAPIEYAINNNIKYYDFMGAGRPGDNYGVRDFKLKFGGKLYDFGRFEKVHKPIIFEISKLGLNILNRFKFLK